MRNGRPFEALLLIATSPSENLDGLLNAFGIDPEEFLIGEWLSKKSLPDHICKAGGEKAAGMVMDWIDLHFDTEFQLRKNAEKGGSYDLPADTPYFPRTELTRFLSPASDVSNGTKSRIMAYIETRGTKLTPYGNWLYSVPKGAEKWFVPIARRGLEDPLNSVRKRASMILRRADVEFPEVELLPDVKFHVTLNGKPWPENLGQDGRLHLTVFTKRSESGSPPRFRGNSQVICDGDDFRGDAPYRAFFTVPPAIVSGDLKIPEGSPRLRAEVNLPVVFEGTNQVDFKTTQLTISPEFPPELVASGDLGYTVQMASEYPNRKFGAELTSFERKIGEPLVLPMVSEGIYWLRITHPGAAVGEMEQIGVDKRNSFHNPRLTKGASLVVPVEWPELSNPEKLPPELAAAFVWERTSFHDSLKSVVRIRKSRDGGVMESLPVSPELPQGRYPNSVIFPFLSPGKYTIESPDRIIESSGTSPGCVIKRSSIEIEIRKDSPVFVVTEPLTILYTRKD